MINNIVKLLRFTLVALIVWIDGYELEIKIMLIEMRTHFVASRCKEFSVAENDDDAIVDFLAILLILGSLSGLIISTNARKWRRIFPLSAASAESHDNQHIHELARAR